MLVPDISKQYFADILFKTLTDFSTLYLALFKNNYTVSDATTLSLLTEANYSGYARIQLGTYLNFTRGPISFPDIYPWIYNTTTTFIHNGGPVANNIFGIYLISTYEDSLQAGPPTEYLLSAENILDAPVIFQNNGDKIESKLILGVGRLDPL